MAYFFEPKLCIPGWRAYIWIMFFFVFCLISLEVNLSHIKRFFRSFNENALFLWLGVRLQSPSIEKNLLTPPILPLSCRMSYSKAIHATVVNYEWPTALSGTLIIPKAFLDIFVIKICFKSVDIFFSNGCPHGSSHYCGKLWMAHDTLWHLSSFLRHFQVFYC